MNRMTISTEETPSETWNEHIELGSSSSASAKSMKTFYWNVDRHDRSSRTWVDELAELQMDWPGGPSLQTVTRTAEPQQLVLLRQHTHTHTLSLCRCSLDKLHEYLLRDIQSFAAQQSLGIRHWKRRKKRDFEGFIYGFRCGWRSKGCRCTSVRLPPLFFLLFFLCWPWSFTQSGCFFFIPFLHLLYSFLPWKIISMSQRTQLFRWLSEEITFPLFCISCLMINRHYWLS